MIQRRIFLLSMASLPASIGFARADFSGADTFCDPVRSIRDQLAPLIGSAQKRFKCPAISLELVTGERVFWSEGFGFGDVARDLRATPRTVFRGGSLAKPLVATAVLQLAEAGEIDIDQPLARYVPELSIRSRFDSTSAPITVRSVLCHHAGLPTDLNKGMWTDEPFTGVASALGDEFAAFPPNLVFSYSNVGYSLLGHLIEKVSGIRFGDYMASRVLGPLGMTRSNFGSHPRVAANLASGYRAGKAMNLLPIRDLPAHGLNTTAADQGRYLRALLGGGVLDGNQLLSPATLEEMFAPQNRDNDLDMSIFSGMGWFLDEGSIPGCGRVLRHGGSTPGFSAEAVLLPEDGLGVVVLANADGSRNIVARLAEEILKRMLADAPTSATAGGEVFLASLERPPSERQPAEIAGDYATDLGLISIRPDEARLCICIYEISFNLIPTRNGWFGVAKQGAEPLSPALQPLVEMQLMAARIEGREVLVARSGGKEMVLGEKVAPPSLSPAWLGRLGRYEVVNADPGFPVLDLELRLREGYLCMRYRMPQLSQSIIEVPLRPISDTEAIIPGIGRTRGETVRMIDMDGGERIRYSGLIARKTD